MTKSTGLWMTATGLSLIMAQAASAQAVAPGGGPAAMEARIRSLEAAVQMLRAELAASRAGTGSAAMGTGPVAPLSAGGAAPVQTAQGGQGGQGGQGIAPGTAAAAPIASQATAAASPVAGEGFRIGSTTLKIGGFVKLWMGVNDFDGGVVPNNSVGRDFYFPPLIPVGGVSEGRQFEAHAKQSRIQLATSTPIGDHLLKGLIEMDFQVVPGTQGNQRVVNGYDLGLRRAFFTYDNWLFGQEWTTFQYVGALPETTNFVGPAEGSVFVRQAQIRYTKAISPQLELAVALENPEATTTGLTDFALFDNGDDRLPDLAARALFKPAFGEFSLSGLFRKLTYDAGTYGDSTTGWGVSFAGKVPFGPKKRYDLRFMLTHGSGIGRYVGLGLAPDAVHGLAADARLDAVDVTAGFAALRLGWTDALRSTVSYSFQDADYPDRYVFTGGSKSARSYAGNLFYSPVKALDLGVEYRRGRRELISGRAGNVDIAEFAAKYAF